MRKLISENLNFIEEILLLSDINKNVLENLITLNNLKENISVTHLNNPKNGPGWMFSMGFVKKINSIQEFKKYLNRNKIKGYKLVEKDKYICEDYQIIFHSGIRVEFYNPDE